MKKIISLLVVIALMATLATTAFAAKAGETVTVEFVTEGNPGFAAFGAVIDYPTDALTLVSVGKGALTQNGMLAEKDGKVGYGASELSEGDGVLFTATFTVNENAAPDTYTVSVNLDKNATSDLDANLVSFKVKSAQVVVEGEHVHVYTETVKLPNCTDKGLRTFTCTCGDTYTEEIPALGHMWGKWEHIGDPNYHVRYCQRVCEGVKCDHKQTEGHNMVELKELERTEVIDGFKVTIKTHECSVCKYRVEGLDKVPLTGDITPVIVTSVVAVIGMITLAAYMLKRKFAL